MDLRRTLSATVAVSVLVFMAGCGGGSISPPKAVPVSGTVVYKAKVKGTDGVRVTFHPQFDMGAVKWEPTGMTDKDGKFTLSTGAPGNGAPPGDYKVTFELIRVESDRKSGIETEVDVWKGKYNNLDTAPKVTIGSAATQLEPFNLD